MKLEYKILWIDNDDKIYKDHQSIIEEHLIDLGFTPIIEKGTDYQAFDKFESNLEQFDLFLLDYKLDGSQNGNEINFEINSKKVNEISQNNQINKEKRDIFKAISANNFNNRK